MLKQDFNIQINGELFYCMQSISVNSLLLYLNIDAQANLVEYNNEILDIDQLDVIFLKQDDQIEIMTLVGGG
uniref:Thiamin biosynthesis protein S n=1 Tax=Helminthocladia australis TaxID=260093 RepID=A0A1G4NTP2_9FLOR|nr:Thiamin biosynthesis protein S [Helminthocladia australis]SCW22052.1 Thiamin biosynthesis protein S [Helminthocladia australis]